MRLLITPILKNYRPQRHHNWNTSILRGQRTCLKDFQLSLSLPSDQVIPSRRTMCSRSIPLFIVFTGDDWNTSGSNNRCTKHNSCNKHFRSLSFCPISNPDYIFPIAYSQFDHDFIKLQVMKYFCKKIEVNNKFSFITPQFCISLKGFEREM